MANFTVKVLGEFEGPSFEGRAYIYKVTLQAENEIQAESLALRDCLVHGHMEPIEIISVEKLPFIQWW